MPSCPVCNTEHILKTSPVTGEPLLADCLKALAKRNAALEESLAEGGAHVFDALNERLTALEGLVGQKVCFTTCDSTVADLRARLAVLEADAKLRAITG
jgi:predicted metal-binding protein